MDCVPVYVLTIFAPLDLLPKVYSSAVVGLGDSSLHNVHVHSTSIIYNNVLFTIMHLAKISSKFNASYQSLFSHALKILVTRLM